VVGFGLVVGLTKLGLFAAGVGRFGPAWGFVVGLGVLIAGLVRAGVTLTSSFLSFTVGEGVGEGGSGLKVWVCGPRRSGLSVVRVPSVTGDWDSLTSGFLPAVDEAVDVWASPSLPRTGSAGSGVCSWLEEMGRVGVVGAIGVPLPTSLSSFIAPSVGEGGRVLKVSLCGPGLEEADRVGTVEAMEEVSDSEEEEPCVTPVVSGTTVVRLEIGVIGVVVG